MSDWLTPVRAALDARDSPVAVFFRDDDGGWADERLFDLLDTFERHGVGVDVAVIPEALTVSLAGGIVRRRSQSLARFHQHGWAHRNHESTGRKCEFGPSRDMSAMQEDVAAGWSRLETLLGDAVDPVFTPPWNRCVVALGPCLTATGLRVLSRDLSAGSIGCESLTEVPISVDWFGRTRGERWTNEQRAIQIADAFSRNEPVGVMLHHAVTDSSELAAVESLVALVAEHDSCAPTNIVDVAATFSGRDR